MNVALLGPKVMKVNDRFFVIIRQIRIVGKGETVCA